MQTFRCDVSPCFVERCLTGKRTASAKQGVRFHPAYTVAVTKVRGGDPILGVAAGTVVLQVRVDENGKIEDVAAPRGIEGLIPHVRWVRTWT